MEILSFFASEFSQSISYPTGVNKGPRVLYLDFLFALDLIPFPPRAQRRYAFQSPFGIWQALKQLVAIDRHLLLPARLLFLPAEPKVRAFRDRSIQERCLLN